MAEVKTSEENVEQKVPATELERQPQKADGAIAIAEDLVDMARQARKGALEAAINHPDPLVMGAAAAANQGLGAQLAPAQNPNPAPTNPPIPEAALARLDQNDRNAIQDMLSGRRGAGTQQNLRELLTNPTFLNGTNAQQAGLLHAFMEMQCSEMGQAQLLSVLTPGSRLNTQFTSLTPAQQQQFLDIFEQSNLNGRNYLIQLLEMPRPAGYSQQHGAQPSHALLSRDSAGRTLLDNLHTLATGPLNPALEQNGIRRHELLQGVLQETAAPGEVNQSCRGTCTVTSMQWMLCMREPAEYARLVAGLSSPQGSVQLRNGDTLNLRPTTILPDETNRTPSERFFQSSMMEYAIGNGMIYSNLTDSRHSGFMGMFSEGVALVRRAFGAQSTVVDNGNGSGLYDHESTRAMSALFGQPHALDTGNRGFFSNLWGAMREIFSGHPENAANHFRPAYHVVQSLQANPGPHWISMNWGAPDEHGRVHGGHAVVVTRVEEGRVYFRNPWGPRGDANGTVYQHPPRRMENNSIGEESMTIEDFMNCRPGTIQPVR